MKQLTWKVCNKLAFEHTYASIFCNGSSSLAVYRTLRNNILGALQSIPQELIESAQIDGANRIQIFFRVVLPEIANFTNICVILCVTGSLKAFEHSWIMTGGYLGVRSAYLGGIHV